MGNRLALISDEMLEDFEFFGGEMNFLAPNGYAPLFEIYGKILRMEGRKHFRGRMPAERGAHPSKQLLYAEGFGDVVVGSSIEGNHLVALSAADCKDNDRSVCGAPDFAAS